jgi:hypothetical protein
VLKNIVMPQFKGTLQQSTYSLRIEDFFPVQDLVLRGVREQLIPGMGRVARSHRGGADSFEVRLVANEENTHDEKSFSRRVDVQPQ